MNQAIVFFDGVCNLCNGTVDFLLRVDRQRRLRFASLQGETAKQFLGPQAAANMASIIFLCDGKTYTESEAVLEIGVTLGGGWRFLARLAGIIPRAIRDGVYRWVAKNRYRLFGQREACRVPTSEERDLLLP